LDIYTENSIILPPPPTFPRKSTKHGSFPQKWINLSEYLKELNLKPKATKKISEKIIKAIHHSKFIKFKRGVILVKKHKNLKELIGEI